MKSTKTHSQESVHHMYSSIDDGREHRTSETRIDCQDSNRQRTGYADQLADHLKVTGPADHITDGVS